MAKEVKEKKGPGKPKGHDEAASNEPAQPARLRLAFKGEVAKGLAEDMGLGNPMSHPKLEKIVVNVNMGRHLENNKLPANVKDTVHATLMKVTGQKPILLKAKKSVSNFKVREGAETAYMVTLRRERMWHFLDRLINVSIPRIKDFRGLSDKAFDQSGNYSMGLNEQGVFPEIDMANANFTHGMNINMIFARSNPKASRYVLEKLGFPFKRPEEKRQKASA